VSQLVGYGVDEFRKGCVAGADVLSVGCVVDSNSLGQFAPVVWGTGNAVSVEPIRLGFGLDWNATSERVSSRGRCKLVYSPACLDTGKGVVGRPVGVSIAGFADAAFTWLTIINTTTRMKAPPKMINAIFI
jgi:hypothetical protein